MNKADEALADVRRWLCDNLSDGEAGKACGMLSVVSRHVNELEEENDKLREQVMRLQSEWESERDYADQMEAKEKRAIAENDKLREACAELLRMAEHHDNEWLHWPEMYEELRRLGIKVSK